VGWKLHRAHDVSMRILVEREPMWDGNESTDKYAQSNVHGLSENQCGMETGQHSTLHDSKNELSENQCGMETNALANLAACL